MSRYLAHQVPYFTNTMFTISVNHSVALLHYSQWHVHPSTPILVLVHSLHALQHRILLVCLRLCIRPCFHTCCTVQVLDEGSQLPD